jgi:hypothetical protein
MHMDIFKIYLYRNYALVEIFSFISNYLFASFQIQGNLWKCIQNT